MQLNKLTLQEEHVILQKETEPTFIVEYTDNKEAG
jgi:peptide methionine sulfoxide reductase MsrB